MKSYSKHRTSDASFCDECKCYVCSNCNCQVYHLSYQEELWAESEQKTEQKKSSKKNKNKKKKEKAKQKKTKPESGPVVFTREAKEDKNTAGGNKDNSVNDHSRLSTASTASEGSKEGHGPQAVSSPKEIEYIKEPNGEGDDNDDEEDKLNQQPSVDFVLYLQQTGSIIALAKLMDALEYGEDFDEELDDSELKLIREQQTLSSQQAN